MRTTVTVHLIAVTCIVVTSGCATRPLLPPPVKTAAPPPSFEDVTTAAGLKGASGSPCAWGDFNNDNRPDVIIGPTLYRNNGDGTFTTVEKTISGPGLWADFDNDGKLDFLSTRGKGSLHRNVGQQQFENVQFPGNPSPSRPWAAAADANNDGWLDLYITNYEKTFGGPIMPDQFYRQKGEGIFSEPKRLTDGACWAARGANWADFDNDGDQDLYVSNYRLMPNNLWVNDGTGHFQDEAKKRGVYGVAKIGKQPASKYYPAYEYTGHTIGSCWGDLNNDGNLDLAVVNFSHPPKWQNRVQIQINSGPPAYTFTNINAKNAAGIYWQESYAKGALGDYDNDGDLDLYITTVYKGDRGDLFENDGTGRFKAVGDARGVRTAGTYQVAWADYDNDGDLDLLVHGKLFQNQGNRNAWLKIRVRGGNGSNVSGIGTRLRITAGNLLQIREVSAGNSGNQQPLVQHIGLGDWSDSVTVEATFPSGAYLKRTVTPRQSILMDENQAQIRPLQ
ncbi:MAG: CRTAC1 family protein [Kiritimatiellales bacterium]|nr:CRTAC1 family protein [Kiritimatiellales bacterium]